MDTSSNTMTQPLYRFFMARPTEAAYALSDDERQGLLGKVQDALRQVGGHMIMLCDTSWSTEQWPIFGLTEFPDLEAVQRHEQILNELNWGRYLESTTFLGTKYQLPG